MSLRKTIDQLWMDDYETAGRTSDVVLAEQSDRLTRRVSTLEEADRVSDRGSVVPVLLGLLVLILIGGRMLWMEVRP